MKKIILSILTVVLVASCGDREGDLKDRVGIENQDAIDKQNQNLKKKADLLQKDLDKMRSFIDAVEGEYLGVMKTEDYKFNVRMDISATFPDYDSNHEKTLAELEYELQNLKLNIKYTSWSESSSYAGGCAYPDVQPDIETGLIRVFSEKCPVDYYLYISDVDDLSVEKAYSEELAFDIKNGEIEEVQFLKARHSSIHNSNINNFVLEKQ